MAFPGDIYAPPGTYTKTSFNENRQGTVAPLKIPTLVGTGNEVLSTIDQESVRGSSPDVDQRVIQENMAGRAVAEITATGQIILGEINGSLQRFQVRNFPIVDGQGNGRVTDDRTSVAVSINNSPVVVQAVDGERGLLTLATSPKQTDDVRVSYAFNRTDTATNDDVSDQVTSGAGEILGQLGLASGELFSVTTDLNDTLSLIVDAGVSIDVLFPAGNYSPSQAVALINGASGGTTLRATSFLNSEGRTAIKVLANHDVTIGSGSANGVFGFVANASSSRNKTFHVFQRPIVDGSNGGITTTDTTAVVVRIDNVLVVPVEVDGTNGAVTLAVAPADGQRVSIGYFFNSWQDTFDVLPQIGVIEVVRAGVTPGRDDYIQGVDFVLQDDKILWGSAVLASTGDVSPGSVDFGANQVAVALVDNKAFLEPCAPVVDSSSAIPKESRQEFTLPYVPTTGNGRDTPLDADLYQSVANSRLDLPTNRPDLVKAYWGFSIQDAISRGPVAVVKVDSSLSRITLQDAIPAQAKVWATFWYNLLQDNAYSLEVIREGASGVGSYSITDRDGSEIYDVQMTGKSPSLSGITVVYPRGSELFPDSRIEGNPGSFTFVGPVEEAVTVEFTKTEDSPAKYVISGPGDYYPTKDASDRAALRVDNILLSGGLQGINVDDPTGSGAGFFASLLGDEVIYDEAGGTVNYTVTADDTDLSLTIDGVVITASVSEGIATIADYVNAVNDAATSGGDAATQYKSATRFTSSTVITLNEYDQVIFSYNGDVTGAQTFTLSLTAGTYNSASQIATQLNTQVSVLPSPVSSTEDVTVTAAALLDGDTLGIGGLSYVGRSIPSLANEFDIADQVEATITVDVGSAVIGDGDTFTLKDGSGATLATMTARTSGVTLAVDEFDARPLTAASGIFSIQASPLANIGMTLVINATTFTSVSGAPAAGEFEGDAGSFSAIAISLAASINASAENANVVAVPNVPAIGSVTVTASTAGTAGNAFTFTTSDALDVSTSVAGVVMTGGVDADDAANSFQLEIDSGLNSFTPFIASTGVVGNVVTLEADAIATPGIDGNALTAETSNATGIDIGGGLTANLTGGIDHPAKKLAAVINADTSSLVSALYVSPTTVNLTAKVGGTTGDSILLSTTNPPSIAVDGANPSIFFSGGIDGFGGGLLITGDSQGRLTFAFTKDSTDASAFMSFLTNPVPARDFGIIAGLDSGLTAGSSQTKIYDGPIARRYTVGVAPLLHDRLIMRNRILPGSGSLAPFHAVSQTGITVQGVGNQDFIGLISQETASAGFSATIQPSTLSGLVGLVSGQQPTGTAGDESDGQPIVVFYNGSGTAPANNIFKFTIDGVAMTTVFSASASGTATPLGPAGIAGTILDSLADTIATAGFSGGVKATVIADGTVRPEGAGIRLTSPITDQFSQVQIGDGSANGWLGFVTGASSLRTPVNVRVLASSLMAHAKPSAAFIDYILNYASPDSTYFAKEALAGFELDNVGAEYLYLQSQTVGVSSSVAWETASIWDILLPGTRLLDSSGDGASGEEGVSGFFVTSSDPASGSGTSNTSVFNSGTGQDGIVGQTYRDDITGLSFTILSREGGNDYPIGSQVFFGVSKTLLSESNIPVRAIGGIEMRVTDTAGSVEGNTAIVQTFEKGGAEPLVGDLYYASYNYLKRDFSAQLFTRLSAVTDSYGDVSPNSPLSLAAYLAFVNGAVTVGLKQVQRDTETGIAPISAYENAIEDLERSFSGGTETDIIVPLAGTKDDIQFLRFLSLHLDVMSSIRYRKERTAIVGFSPSALPNEIGAMAQKIQNRRVRMTYPDSALVSLTGASGIPQESLIEGFFISAALAGSTSSPNTDVATPWTKRSILGLEGLGRNLDPVEANSLAVQGVTIFTQEGTQIKVRHGLTTDMRSQLTKLPTITLIADEVQQRARRVLEPFIGKKYLPGILPQVEGRLGQMLRGMIREQILASYSGVNASVDPTNPTAGNVKAVYQPIFPLLYLLLDFNLRSGGV